MGVASLNMQLATLRGLGIKNTKLFGLIGERNSVGFTATPNIEDAINPATNNFANRRVDRDYYKNFGLENRNIYKYKLVLQKF